MSGRISAACERALNMIGKPRGDGTRWTAYSAAKVQGINLSTIPRLAAQERGEAMRGQSGYFKFDHGEAAYERGLDREDCPYDEGTEERAQWLAGWEYAWWAQCGDVPQGRAA